MSMHNSVLIVLIASDIITPWLKIFENERVGWRCWMEIEKVMPILHKSFAFAPKGGYTQNALLDYCCMFYVNHLNYSCFSLFYSINGTYWFLYSLQSSGILFRWPFLKHLYVLCCIINDEIYFNFKSFFHQLAVLHLNWIVICLEFIFGVLPQWSRILE